MNHYEWAIVTLFAVSFVACFVLMLHHSAWLASRIEWHRGDKTPRALAYGANVKAMADKAKADADAKAKARA